MPVLGRKGRRSVVRSRGPCRPVEFNLENTGCRALHRGFLQGSINREQSGQGSIRALNGENPSGFRDASTRT